MFAASAIPHLLSGLFGDLLFVIEVTYQEGTFFVLGSEPVTLYFTSDSIFPFPGFRLYYYVGEGSPGKTSSSCFKMK